MFQFYPAWTKRQDNLHTSPLDLAAGKFTFPCSTPQVQSITIVLCRKLPGACLPEEWGVTDKYHGMDLRPWLADSDSNASSSLSAGTKSALQTTATTTSDSSSEEYRLCDPEVAAADGFWSDVGGTLDTCSCQNSGTDLLAPLNCCSKCCSVF